MKKGTLVVCTYWLTLVGGLHDTETEIDHLVV